MDRGYDINTFMNLKEKEKGFQLVINTNKNNLENYWKSLTDMLLKLNLKIIRYCEEWIKDDIYKIDLIASTTQETKDEITINQIKKNLKIENNDILEISDPSKNFIINNYPYRKISMRSLEEDIVLPIYSRRYFTRFLNNLVCAFSADILGKFSSYSYGNGFFALAEKYIKKCADRNSELTNYESNEDIIKQIFLKETVLMIISLSFLHILIKRVPDPVTCEIMSPIIRPKAPAFMKPRNIFADELKIL